MSVIIQGLGIGKDRGQAPSITGMQSFHVSYHSGVGHWERQRTGPVQGIEKDRGQVPSVTGMQSFHVSYHSGVGHWERQRTGPVRYWYVKFSRQLSFRGWALGKTEDRPHPLLVCKVFTSVIIQGLSSGLRTCVSSHQL